MPIDFPQAIAFLGGSTELVRLINDIRPPSNYLFNTLLPERSVTSVTVDSATMTIAATMAGLVGMDSAYPPGGQVKLSEFMERAAKVAVSVMMSEGTLEKLLELLTARMAYAPNSNIKEILANEALGFYTKVIIQSLLDRAEWLRGQALCKGMIDWGFNGVNLSVDYGIPAANKLAPRTGTGAYNQNTANFWEDIRMAWRILGGSFRAAITHSTLLNSITADPSNGIITTEIAPMTYRLQRVVSLNGQNTVSSDVRDSITLVVYDEEGEVMNPANPDVTIKVPFMDNDKIIFVGQAGNRGYRVGQGVNQTSETGLELGFTALAPTIEGNGQPGRWGRMYSPEARPYHLIGEAVMKILPVIEAPSKLVIAQSEV